MSRVQAILLDVDGTLLDSNDLHAHAWSTALKEHGFDRSFTEVRRLIGMGGDKLLPALTGVSIESSRGKSIGDASKRIFLAECLPKVRGFPRARELLLRMRAQGLKLVVATSAADDLLDAMLEKAGLADLLVERVTADDAAKSKPDPDILEAALRRIGMSADQALFIGDTPYDLEAGKRAGVATIALRSGGWDDASFQGAVAIYDGVEDLLARYDQSPLSQGGETARA